jgi:hypothetical protein
MVGGAIALIALETLTRGKGPEQGGKLLTWISQGIRKALLSKDVAAIPTAKKAPPGKAPAAKPKPGQISTGPLGLGTNPPVSV